MNSNLESVEAYGKLFGKILEGVFPSTKPNWSEIDEAMHKLAQCRQAEDMELFHAYAQDITRLARILVLENQVEPDYVRKGDFS